LLAALGWTSLPWLALLRQPTLVMAGRDDPLVPRANACILARLIPDARLVVVDDGHLFLITSAGASARSIAQFVAD
jgi:pimeloyl-ACP methyl ester carboxylesterase